MACWLVPRFVLCLQGLLLVTKRVAVNNDNGGEHLENAMAADGRDSAQPHCEGFGVWAHFFPKDEYDKNRVNPADHVHLHNVRTR
jgi:hypothetical protein